MKVKTCPTKLLEAKTESEGDQQLGRVHALVSVFNSVDWDGDRIVRGAFSDTLAKWREKGDPIPFIWSHEWHNWDAHIGKVPPELARETDRGLEVTAYMDLDDPPAAKVYELLKDRRVTQFSFAYDVLESEETDEDTDKGFLGKVVELHKLDLYECGPTLLGANQETDLLEVAARGVRRARQAAVSPGSRARLADAVDLIQQVIDSDEQPDEAGRGAGAKAAIGPHGTGTSDDAWDGPGNESNLSNDAGAATYRRAYAWVDPDGDPDAKASYKFIHHFVSSDGRVGAASTRACSTGIAVLNGGRGGSNIPDSDRRGVYNHLARHLRDADMEPPELASADAAADAATAPPEYAELQQVMVGVT